MGMAAAAAVFLLLVVIVMVVGRNIFVESVVDFSISRSTPV